MAFNNLIRSSELPPYQGYDGNESYIHINTVDRQQGYVVNPNVQVVPATAIDHRSEIDNSVYNFEPVQDLEPNILPADFLAQGPTNPNIQTTPTSPDERITIPNVQVFRPAALTFPPSPPITLPSPTPPQGEDKFAFSDVNYLLTMAVNVLDPGLLQGVIMPDQSIWQAKTDQFKNDPVSVQGTAYLYPNQEFTSLEERQNNQDSIITTYQNDPGRIDKFNALSYAQIQKISAKTTLGGPIEDYQSELPMYQQNAANVDSKNQNIHKRLRIPNYGQFGIDRSDYLNDTGLNDPMMVDSYSESVSDFIKFKFKDGRDPSNKRVQFRAFLTEFNDSDTFDYESVSYIGQPDPGFVFTSVFRTVNIGFITVAHSRNELRGMYNRLNELRSMALPGFKNTAKYMIGGFTLFTLGDYFKDIPCIITNMSRDVKIDLYPWEINMRGEDLFEAPKMIDVRLSINILGHQTPSTQIKSFDML